MGMLENATAALASILDTHASVPITYSRGMTSISGLTAIRGSTPYESSDADGIIHRTIARDYLMRADTFPFSDMPRDGDIISDGEDYYLVHSMTGERPWRYSDPGQSLLRIHTKKQP
jgi:hypothetical protein